MVIKKTSRKNVKPKVEVCTCYESYCHCGHFGFPLFLLVIGALWLAKSYGLLGINFWPWLLIIVGLVLVIKHAIIFRKK
jgi:hypothetical protein